MTFTLHPNLARKSFVIDLPLCTVLLEDNQHYPWLLLVPRKADTSRMIDLSPEDQMQLMVEMTQAQNILWEMFSPTQLNVAALGNKTPQLHVHVIARTTSDPAWPGGVWDHPTKEPYGELQRSELIARLQEAFSANLSTT
jgi:diadenosine tetraphosphate (Ap4A) HIT family hydrolase